MKATEYAIVILGLVGFIGLACSAGTFVAALWAWALGFDVPAVFGRFALACLVTGCLFIGLGGWALSAMDKPK